MHNVSVCMFFSKAAGHIRSVAEIYGFGGMEKIEGISLDDVRWFVHSSLTLLESLTGALH